MHDYIRSTANLARLASLSSGLEARVPIALDGSPKRGGLNPVITLRKINSGTKFAKRTELSLRQS